MAIIQIYLFTSMQSKKWVKFIIVIVILLSGIAITIFLGFQKHTVEAKVTSCTERGITTAQGKYRFPPQLGLEGITVLIIDQNGGLFNAAYPDQICNGEGNITNDITAIEYTGLGYVTALYVSYERPEQ